MDDLNKLTKKELIHLINSQKGSLASQSNRITNRLAQIRHFRIRLKKIRNSLDYLLVHPYSNDTGWTTRKYKRDIPRNQKSKTK